MAEASEGEESTGKPREKENRQVMEDKAGQDGMAKQTIPDEGKQTNKIEEMTVQTTPEGKEGDPGGEEKEGDQEDKGQERKHWTGAWQWWGASCQTLRREQGTHPEESQGPMEGNKETKQTRKMSVGKIAK